MHQFYIDDIQTLELSKEQKHQIKTVLRMRQGDKIRLVDAQGEGVVAEVSDMSLETFTVLEPINFYQKTRKLTIIASLIRNERQEWMIQKSAEAGVDEIIFYSADHGVVKDYGNKEKRKIERFQTIALEASEQALRQTPLKIEKIIKKDQLKENLGICNLFADTAKAPHYLNVIENETDITVIVGPEGGFSEKERTLFLELNMKPVSLGHNIYRAETAPIAIAVLTHID